MTDYKNTLNLPETDFPMRANLPVRELEILQRWQSLGLYEKIQTQNKGKKRFILHDGPPYANARPHLGTALNKILKDMVVKSKLLSGYDAPYIPGWDCHGLPIELNVEKKLGQSLSPREFRAACRRYAESQVALQREDFQRLGVLGDWQHPYLTMDFTYEANVVRALAQLVTKGYVYRGQKPVHWCTACSSALAEAEVEYRDQSSPAIDVNFVATAPDDVLKRFHQSVQSAKIILPIWTTTPWTLLANQAVSVHPALDYALVSTETAGASTYFVLADALVETVMARYGISHYKKLSSVKGAVLEGILLQHPFLNRVVPVILGEHVTVDVGTGNVHTAPAHGLDDYVVGQRYHLPQDNPVDGRGCFMAGTPLVAGLFVLKANELIMAMLTEREHLLHRDTISHSYPYCWRHKIPLIFRATPQWFVSMTQKELRAHALQAIATTTWMPSWGAARIQQMVTTRPDWCISRQRNWGVPLTLCIHKKTGALHPRIDELMEKAAAAIEKNSVDAWFDLDLQEWLGKEAADYEKVTDILDVWFESGVTHFCVLAQRAALGFPADLYLEGSDQHRGWFQSSLLTAVAMSGHAPFRSVLTHGYVIDLEGRKMSKSVGNVILPADVVKNLGADILRLWAASMDYTVEIHASHEILTRLSDAYRRLRNTMRFLLSNLNDFDPSSGLVDASDLLSLDRWAIVTTMTLQEKILHAYDQYRFAAIYQMIHNFCTVELGSFYLDIIKDRLYTTKKTGLPRRSAQTALYYIAEALVRWLAPIMSFTAEEVWQKLPGTRSASVFLDTWFQHFPSLSLSEAEAQRWQLLLEVRAEVNKALESARQAGAIGSGLEAQVLLFADEPIYTAVQSVGDELRFLLITSAARVFPWSEKSDGAIATALPLALEILVSPSTKCARCWQRVATVGQHAQHLDLCERCIENVFGDGEERRVA